MHEYYIPTAHSNYYESLLRSLLENQIFLYYNEDCNVMIGYCRQITTNYHLKQTCFFGILEHLFLGTPDCLDYHLTAESNFTVLKICIILNVCLTKLEQNT